MPSFFILVYTTLILYPYTLLLIILVTFRFTKSRVSNYTLFHIIFSENSKYIKKNLSIKNKKCLGVLSKKKSIWSNIKYCILFINAKIIPFYSSFSSLSSSLKFYFLFIPSKDTKRHNHTFTKIIVKLCRNLLSTKFARKSWNY